MGWGKVCACRKLNTNFYRELFLQSHVFFVAKTAKKWEDGRQIINGHYPSTGGQQCDRGGDQAYFFSYEDKVGLMIKNTSIVKLLRDYFEHTWGD